MALTVSEIYAIIGRYEKRIAELEKDARYYSQTIRSESVNEAAFNFMIAEIGQQAVTILSESAMRACVSSLEYNDPFFIGNLMKAVNDERTLVLKHLGGKNLEVIIDLDKTAGTLEEYAGAVKAARETMLAQRMGGAYRGGQAFFAPAWLASEMWYEKIFAVDRLGVDYIPRRKYNRVTRQYEVRNVADQYRGKYWETIFLRYAFLSKPAPWWRLLEDGNNPGRMSSDRGGLPKPHITPTHFVKNASVAIKFLAKGVLERQIEEIRASLRRQIDNILLEIYGLRQEIEKLRALLDEEAIAKRAEELLRQRLGQKFEYANPDRVKMLLDQLTKGIRVNPKSGVRLGSHEGKSVRIRVINIAKQLNKEFSK